MKTLVSIGIAAACVALSGCATCKNTTLATGDLSAYVTLIRISANVDGSDRFIFTPRHVHYEHKFWSRPTDVNFNGEPWTDLDHSPAGWRDFSRHLDLTRAWIVKRQGRDVSALERTAKGFDLYLCDSPNGSAYYDVTIAVPRQIEPSPNALDRCSSVKSRFSMKLSKSSASSSANSTPPHDCRAVKTGNAQAQ